MSKESDIISIASFESSDNDRVLDLTRLQYDIAALAEYEEMLIKLQEQRIRDNLNFEFEEGIKELTGLEERINTLSAQLETEMFKFKEIAVKTNRTYWAIQQRKNSKFSNRETLKLNYRIPHSIWQLHSLVIPMVFKREGVFVLTTRKVDLFLEEREINPKKIAKESQKRRQSLEIWLLKMRH
ncbi:hypothetical protein NIES22_01070 [Calothrix brevissima NIES-22]|nr:hypothetical protein NIES22_01070 [Calothrix brevissima NIES-22]